MWLFHLFFACNHRMWPAHHISVGTEVPATHPTPHDIKTRWKMYLLQCDLSSEQDTLRSLEKSCRPHRNDPPPLPGFAISILGKSYRKEQVPLASKIHFPKWRFCREVGCSSMSNMLVRWQRGHQDTAAHLPAGWGRGRNQNGEERSTRRGAMRLSQLDAFSSQHTQLSNSSQKMTWQPRLYHMRYWIMRLFWTVPLKRTDEPFSAMLLVPPAQHVGWISQPQRRDSQSCPKICFLYAEFKTRTAATSHLTLTEWSVWIPEIFQFLPLHLLESRPMHVDTEWWR